MTTSFKAMLVLISFLSGLSLSVQASDQQGTPDFMPSLITETPLEGRMLAMTIIRKTIGMTQKDKSIKFEVRKQYEDAAELLMRASELVAIEFKTIAIANNYWR